ncbi:tRNA (adenosine(37)-N6)-dimethylallyltransferase MiaA [Piscinibacter sakaiensis]|uniref:tRNA dimethylallyltransferase n=1 Tax=Piscinibacter sakaiensis TaxID=1547922 RepID=A0A0K8P6M0_PISS1|nr:tRNA (adenosine(37)-N6)-dimethylallyltransferase MiaA [Piscinibacter sakaiensis]GAP38256.1 tRNA delta(2)-isopentenylpyrophosphate transferase [Piscinibacter sakaiensis]
MSPPGPTSPLPCLCLAGPTGTGKTAAALAFAQALAPRRRVEIVSVDSALVYRGMDVGTAKPTAAERGSVPHHLIDLIEPDQAYSAARFVADAAAAVAAIRGRGHVPLLVGGTLLYFKALFDGLDAMPPSDPAVRAEIDAEAARAGWPALHARLAQLDPATAARLPPTDAQRIQRALEVQRLSGRPLSSFHTRGPAPDTAGRPPPAALVSLEPADRAGLHARLAARFDAMLADGLLDEVRALRARGDLHAGLPSMRCVGYRQAWEALDAAGDGPLDAAAQALLRERGIAATRQLAKRQLTWLRAMPWRTVVASDAMDAPAQTVAALQSMLAGLDAAGAERPQESG